MSITEDVEGADDPIDGIEGGTTEDAQPEKLYIPNDPLVCFEHPCVVKDIDRAVKALGGEYLIKQIFQTDASTLPPATSLRPDDIFAKRLSSQKVSVDHVLLRVVLPKLTGRKRKRGSDDPFTFHEDDAVPPETREGYDPAVEVPLKAEEFLARMNKVKDAMDIEPVGLIKDSHRFRGLADIQYVAQDVDIMRQVHSHLTEPTLEKIKSFSPNMSANLSPSNIIGPPSFMQTAQPLYYGYAQGPGSKTVVDAEGKMRSINMHAPLRRVIQALPITADAILTERPQGLPPLEECPESLRKVIDRMSKLLEEHPVLTRRAATNIMAPTPEALFKDATQYVSYSFSSGPWKDALIRYGYDPRTDPESRKYQCLTFQLTSKDKRMAAASKMASGSTQWLRAYKVAREDPHTDKTQSHLFNGRTGGTNNKTFQILHITDPLLVPVIATAPFRDVADLGTDGWFTNGTISLLRGIMRDKLNQMVDNQDPDVYAEVYRRIVRAVPSVIHPDNVERVFFTDDTGLTKSMKVRGVDVMGSIRQLGKQDWGKPNTLAKNFPHPDGAGGRVITSREVGMTDSDNGRRESVVSDEDLQEVEDGEESDIEDDEVEEEEGDTDDEDADDDGEDQAGEDYDDYQEDE